MTGSSWSALTSAGAAVFAGVLFAHAAWHKLADFAAFKGLVADYQVTPEPAVTTVAGMVAAAEVAVVCALVLHETRHSGALLAIAMLVGYAAAMALNILRNRRHIDCGCGGPEHAIDWSLVIRNIVLAAIVAVVLLSNAAALSFVEAAVAVAAGVALWSVFVVVEQVRANAAHFRALSPERA